METLLTISNFLIFGLIIITPILILFFLKRLKIKRTFLIYTLIGLFAVGLLVWTFAWWTDKSDMILLEHFGYSYDGWNDIDRFQNVAPENLEKVKRIEISIMGIGWPLKAIFGFVMTIPYMMIVYVGKMLINKVVTKKNEAWQ